MKMTQSHHNFNPLDTKAHYQRLFQAKNGLKSSQPRDRLAKIDHLIKQLWERRPELLEAFQKDFSKSSEEVTLTELLPLFIELKTLRKNLAGWMRPQRVRTPWILWGSRSSIVFEPKGVTLIFSPWNYPVCLSLLPIMTAMASGCPFLLKPSEKTPHVSEFLAQLIEDSLPPEEGVVICGDVKTANFLLNLKFDHIFFTGAPSVGKTVMEKAAQFLTPVTLELGGKSPAIITDSYSLKKAAERVVWGKLLNSGQTCVAPDYLLMPENLKSSFVQEVQKAITHYYPQGMLSHLSEIVNEQRFDHLNNLIDKALSDGATLELGGKCEGRKIELTLLSGLKNDSPLLQEEIFGPILPLVTYKELGEVCAFINQRPNPLALYLFCNNEKTVDFILKNTNSGGVALNNVIMHMVHPHLPFGGHGESGLGQYHGYHGFRAFSHERAIYQQNHPGLLKTFMPPYSEFKKKFLEWATAKASRWLA